MLPDVSETFTRLKDDPHGGWQHLRSLLDTVLMPFVHV